MDTTIQDQPTRNQYEIDDVTLKKLSQIFAALADPVRLHILTIISAEDHLCSCDLEKPTGKSQPTISHHTRVLAEAGLIKAEKRGKWVWWRIDRDTANLFHKVSDLLLRTNIECSNSDSNSSESIC